MNYEITSEVMTDSQLQQYVDRLDYSGPLVPTLAVLQALQFAHLTHIPYENLDSMAHKITSLNRFEMFQKMILSRRGGSALNSTAFMHGFLKKWGLQLKTMLAATFSPMMWCRCAATEL